MESPFPVVVILSFEVSGGFFYDIIGTKVAVGILHECYECFAVIVLVSVHVGMLSGRGCLVVLRVLRVLLLRLVVAIICFG